MANGLDPRFSNALALGGFNPASVGLDQPLFEEDEDEFGDLSGLDPVLAQQTAGLNPGFDPAALQAVSAQQLAGATPVAAPAGPAVPAGQTGADFAQADANQAEALKQAEARRMQQQLLLGRILPQAGASLGGFLDNLIFGQRRGSRNI